MQAAGPPTVAGEGASQAEPALSAARLHVVDLAEPEKGLERGANRGSNSN